MNSESGQWFLLNVLKHSRVNYTLYRGKGTAFPKIGKEILKEINAIWLITNHLVI